MDMCSGPIFPKIIRFALPLMFSGILQLLFNAADIIVVGQFSGSEALAAVGSTSSLISLLINLFIGISVGANVMAARYYGAKRTVDLQETVHTAVCMALICGFMMVFIGISAARPLLQWMGTPDDVIEHSVLYMRIYFAGMPFFTVYNFGAAILRAVGDTQRPMYYLTAAGMINVVFNLLFVIVFRMGVAGVAIATVISQGISAALVIRCLLRSEGPYRLEKDALRITGSKLRAMLQIGLPAGIQGTLINLSNVLIQSSINSFDSLAMAGGTAAGNIENFLYVSVNSISQTALSFTSQNMGAGKYKRVDRVVVQCILTVCGVALVLGGTGYFFGGEILRLYSPDPQVIAFGMERLAIMMLPYAFCGIMDAMPGCIRGIGCSIMPTVISLMGICLFRILWISTIFQRYHTLNVLYLSYPVSWILTSSVQIICYLIMRKRIFPRDKKESRLSLLNAEKSKGG